MLEVQSRLRDIGQPITLFGEKPMVRYRRLRESERNQITLTKHEKEKVDADQNEFLRLLRAMDKSG